MALQLYTGVLLEKRVTLPDHRGHERQKFCQGPGGRRRIGVEVRHRR
jgi:hypothetical protein